MAGLAKNDVFELLELKFNRSKEEIRNGNMKVVEDDARGEVSGHGCRYQRGLESVTGMLVWWFSLRQSNLISLVVL